MKHILRIFFIACLVLVISSAAQAQVRFDVFSTPYTGPTLNVSVGNGYYNNCGRGYYNRGYYNRGYYNRGYYNRGYYNRGYYNTGYYVPNTGYYYNNGYNPGCYTNNTWYGNSYRSRGRRKRGYQGERSPINSAAYWCNSHNEYCTH